jgi:ABC-2 type transport system ATP-binding protein
LAAGQTRQEVFLNQDRKGRDHTDPAGELRRHAGMIEVEDLTKRYGDRTAVDGVSFQVHPGTVTGFLGPNGAGKSTTMRMIAGLDRPTAGRVRVNGRDYRSTPAPMAELGVLLEAKAMHPGRSARDHLLALAQTAGLGKARVDEVIEQVGLTGVKRRRVGGFSLGMGQRLGIAAALLGKPRTIMLDEPVNGLDPEGVRWVRTLLRSLAGEGCTVFVSSHLLGEMADTADRLVVIGRGRVIADSTVDDFVAGMVSDAVVVRTPEAARLRTLLSGPEITVTADSQDTLHVRGMSTDQIGRTAWQANIPVLELSVARGSLEEAFMQATNDSVEFISARQEAVR